MRKVILSDQPISYPIQDMLGYKNYANVLSEIIEDPTLETPLTIGVFGDWGTGKTSLLKLVKNNLEKEHNNIHCVWFDAWKYDRKESLWNALLNTIFVHMIENSQNEGFKKGLAEISLKLTAYMVSKTLEIGTAGVVNLREIYDEVKEVAKVKNDNLRFINDFETTYSDVVRRFTGGSGKLVIFIDDLDRCLPENAIEVLEAIKFFIGQSNCIFFIALNKPAIEQAISHRYKDIPEMSGVEYLEKIINLPFTIPTPTRSQTHSFIDGVTQRAITKELISIISAWALNNPRRIKRFVNSYSLFESMVNMKNLNNIFFAKVLMLQLKFPTFFQAIIQRPEYYVIVDKAIRESQKEKEIIKSTHPLLSKFIDDSTLESFLNTTSHIQEDIAKYLDIIESNYM